MAILLPFYLRLGAHSLTTDQPLDVIVYEIERILDTLGIVHEHYIWFFDQDECFEIAVYATEDAHVIIPRNISHNATLFEDIVSELNSVFKKGF
jgi:hypothetical protein